MKRIKLFITGIILFSLTFAQEPLATIVDQQGSITLRNSGDYSFSNIPNLNTSIQSGDALKTGKNGYAKLEFAGDKSSLQLYSNSHLEITEEFSTRKIILKEGHILADIKPQLVKSYSLETPGTIASFDRAKFRANTDTDPPIESIDGEITITNLVTGKSETLGKKEPTTAKTEAVTSPQPSTKPPLQQEESVTTSQTVAYTPQPKQQETAPEESTDPMESYSTSEKNWNMGLGIGSVTIDGQIYNQIALRPELQFGKLGVGLDLYFYLDEAGNIRQDDWDEFSDYLNKIYYVRWGRQGDPFFFRAGALDYATLGYGILMSGYSNTIEYPQVRNIGLHTGMKYDRMGWEILVADIKEISGPGLIAGRLTYDLFSKFRLGGTFVADFNQYKGLVDTDEDNVPDTFDDFPDKEFNLPEQYPENAFGHQPGDNLKGKNFQVDSDGDGIPDEYDYDIDGDGVTDNYTPDKNWNHDTEIDSAPAPFNMADQAKTLAAVAFDAGIPLIERNTFSLDIYGQSAFFISEKITDFETGEKFSPGWGAAVPGFRASFFNFIHCNLEYRFSGENFLFNFWDRLYDMERVSIRATGNPEKPIWAYTKDELKLYHDPMKGVFGSVDFNFWDFLIFRSYYQHMTSKNDEIRSFRSSLTIPSGKIPKLAKATAFYQRNNDKNPFKFDEPSENTILGYRVSLELGGGAVLSYVYRRTYRDLDGDSSIDPDNEAVTINTIETGFNF